MVHRNKNRDWRTAKPSRLAPFPKTFDDKKVVNTRRCVPLAFECRFSGLHQFDIAAHHHRTFPTFKKIKCCISHSA
jgi:hypothetical protein